MIKVAAIVSVVAGLIVGAIAGSAAIGAEVAAGAFGLGLLTIIAFSVQELVPGHVAAPDPTANDADLIEDIELVFDEAKGELVEVPTTRRRRR